MKKISLVVGGTKGIGKVIVNKLKKRGDKIYTLSRSKEKKNNHFSLDLLGDLSELNKIKKKFHKKKIDNLIFSQRYRGDLEQMDYGIMLKSTDKIINTLKNNISKKGSIPVLSSIATTTVVDDQNAEYHYTRGAVESLVRYYAVKLGSKGIRVNCIQATVIFKPENKKFFSKKNNLTRRIIEHITPLNRMGTAEDMANLANYLSSDDASYITGCIIPVDGGARLTSQEHIIKKFLK